MESSIDSIKARLPHPDKLRHISVGLSALDILFNEKAPVFTFEKNWHTEVSTLLVDTRDGGQLSIRFSGKAALIKGTRTDAFMHPGGTPPFKPETRLGFVTYPGLLDGFPAPLENLLLANDSFAFLTFCLWHLHESGKWETGAYSYPKDVDDPDGSEDLLRFFVDPVSVFISSSAELYGMTVTDIDAVNEVFKQKPLTDALLKRLGVRKSLQSFARRLHEIEYGVDPYIEPASTAAPGDKSSRNATENKSDIKPQRPTRTPAQIREEQLKESTRFTTVSSSWTAIGDFFKDKSEFFKERSASDIAQDALAMALGAVTDVINQVPADSPLRSEPLFKWQRLTGAKLMLARKIGMAGMLDTITAEFVAGCAGAGRKRALINFADALEQDFHTMPEFLFESFEQLQSVYQRADDEYKQDAEVFQARIEKLKKSGTPQPVIMLTDLPVVKIFSSDIALPDRLLNRIRRVLRDCGQNTYYLSSNVVQSESGSDKLEITLVSRDTKRIFEIIKSNLVNLELAEGSYLVDQSGNKFDLDA